MIKLTVLYKHPTDDKLFEDYYKNIHLPKAAKMTGHEKFELTKFLSNSDSNKSDYYRMAEFWYLSSEAMQEAMESPEGKATADDLHNFATGGVTMLVGTIE